MVTFIGFTSRRDDGLNGMRVVFLGAQLNAETLAQAQAGSRAASFQSGPSRISL
jgi:hypothetical protein